MRPDRLAVLGLGAIGGSVAWQARRSGIPSVIGFSPERGEAVQALRAGALTDIADTAGARGAGRRPRGAGRTSGRNSPVAAKPSAVATLPGSADRRRQREAAADVRGPETLGLAARYAGSHPFAGTHLSGWSAARPDLLPRTRSSTSVRPAPRARTPRVRSCTSGRRYSRPIRSLSRPRRMIASWPGPAICRRRWRPSLAYTLGKSSDLTGASWGPGVRDTTRLAASNAELWTEILLLNRKEVTTALAQAGEDLLRLAELIAEENRAGIREFLERGVVFRRGDSTGFPEVRNPPGNEAIGRCA